MIGSMAEGCMGRALLHEAQKGAKRVYETMRASKRLCIHAPRRLASLG